MPKDAARADLLGQIRNPLIFFSLALLVIEGIIGLVVTKSSMTGSYQFVCVCIMATLFLVVVVIVAFITVKHPGHLYERFQKDLQLTHELTEFINSSGFRDAIEDIIEERINAGAVPRGSGKTESQ